MLLGTPTLTTLFLHSCENYQCALVPSVKDLIQSTNDINSLTDLVLWIGAMPIKWFTWKAVYIYMVWYFVQAIMYAVVPGRIGYGQKTLAGNQLPYKVSHISPDLWSNHADWVEA